MKISILALTGAALCATQAGAVELIGGSAELSYSAFTSETSVNRLGIEGSAEVALTYAWSLQGDLGFQRYAFLDGRSTAVGLHGIYRFSSATAVGGFIVHEDTRVDNIDTLGVEVAHEVGAVALDGYLAHFDSGDFDGTIYGVGGRYVMPSGLGVTLSYDRAQQSGDDFYRAGLKLDRDVADRFNLFVEVGVAGTEVARFSGSEPFVGLGGSYAFGLQGGATFDARGLARLLPGG